MKPLRLITALVLLANATALQAIPTTPVWEDDDLTGRAFSLVGGFGEFSYSLATGVFSYAFDAPGSGLGIIVPGLPIPGTFDFTTTIDTDGGVLDGGTVTLFGDDRVLASGYAAAVGFQEFTVDPPGPLTAAWEQLQVELHMTFLDPLVAFMGPRWGFRYDTLQGTTGDPATTTPFNFDFECPSDPDCPFDALPPRRPTLLALRVSEPETMWLFGAGILGLALARRRRAALSV